MSVTLEQVRAVLDPDEPDYEAAAQLGPDALPFLEQLIEQADPMLASKAAYLASLIPGPRSVMVLKEASRSQISQVRVAAAAGAKNLAPTEASDVLLPMLDDQDAGVRIRALKAVPDYPTPELHRKVTAMAENDPNVQVRAFSIQVRSRVRSIP